jgi:hypothetical protein
MDTAWPLTWPKKAEELHVFDPKGDVLLVLKRRSKKDMADYIDKEESAPRWEDEPHPTTEEFEGPVPARLDPLTEHADLPDASTESDSDTAEAEVEAGLENDSTRRSSSTSSVSSAWMMNPKIQKVQMRVSSKHLILASATFQTSLGSDKFSEGRTLQTGGNVVIPLPDEDPDAMIIVLHVIHGQTRRVPRRVSWEMLSRLAFVVNHRQVLEAVEPFSDSWIENLKQDWLTGSNISEKFSRLFILWVFQQETGFRNISQALEHESDYNLEDKADTGTPIPASIIKNIQQRRLNGIESAIQVIYDLITKYSGPDIVCNNAHVGFACDATLLGSLIKSSAAIGIYPRPKYPYPGVTFNTLAEQIREMQILDDCRNDHRGYSSYNRYHGVKDSIDASLNSIALGMSGLKLEEFLPKKTSTMRSQ